MQPKSFCSRRISTRLLSIFCFRLQVENAEEPFFYGEDIKSSYIFVIVTYCSVMTFNYLRYRVCRCILYVCGQDGPPEEVIPQGAV